MNPHGMLLQDPASLKGFWTVDSFNQLYSQPNALRGCAVITVAPPDTSGHPDIVAVATLRTFIENSARAKEDQKYVVGIRFYGFGDMATIDVISLDKDFHKNIAYEHVRRMLWPMLSEQSAKPINELDETTRAPFVVVGGHLKVNPDNKVCFSGASGDYGDAIFFSDSNAIAAYVTSTCGIDVVEGDKEKGAAFVNDLLEIMLKHKLKKDFYEQLVGEIYQRRSDASKLFSAQHIGALITMKALDRAISEDKTMVKMIVDEISGGLGRYFFVAAIAQGIKKEVAE
jgi:hypothetical protein